MNRKSLPVSLLALLSCLISPLGALAGTTTPLHDRWHLQSACVVHEEGAAISLPSFRVEGWLPTTVPATVLAAQVANKVFPDPYFGINLRNVPGTTYPIGHNFSNLPMPQESPYHCGWWYRTSFMPPAGQGRGQRSWLHFDGINYSAEIWLNGHRIADRSRIAGAYRTYDIDVTESLRPGTENVLAVETFAPTEADLGINWVDWNPAPPDKDMGIWGDVSLVTAGAVTVNSPLAVTHFEDSSLSVADLTVYAQVHNATALPVSGVVTGSAAGISFEQPVTLAPHEDKTVAFAPGKFPKLRIRNPTPWWPWQMGEPHLEHLTVAFAERGIKTDEQSADFGFREITSELTATGARLFRVNGRPILIRGAGWSQDMLLRTDPARLQDQIRMVRDMGLNTIRLEGKLETEDFFRLTDRQGILVMLGWCCCDQWEHWKQWTAETLAVATASLHDQMLRLRSHPSLLVWLNGSDNAPPADVERAYLQVEADTHWPNPTLASASAADTQNAGPSGVKMTGPYDYVAPNYWYVDSHHGGGFGFNTETSPGPAIPSLASRRRFLPDPDAWPPTDTWRYHNGGGMFTSLDVFDRAMTAVYTQPHSAAEYTRIAGTMAYDSERAMFEAYSRNKYIATGVVQWMLNNAWPSMIWHLYDYFLDPGAGYYAVKKACEPLHIQYSWDDRSVIVVNSTYRSASALHASVQVHGLGWNLLYSAQTSISAAPDSSQRVFEMPDTLYSGSERIFFIDLSLTDGAGKLVSHNFYWVPGTLTTFDWARTDYTHTPAERHEDLTALAHLPSAQIQTEAVIDPTPNGRRLHVQLHNAGTTLAFQIHLSALTPTGDLIAPVLWSDNWIELAPGESTTLTASLPATVTGAPVLHLDGWNIASIEIAPQSAAVRNAGGTSTGQLTPQ